MTAKLFAQAISKFFLGVVMVGALIFLPAGTFSYLQGWIFAGVLFVPMFLAGIVMMFRNPELLRKRLDAREKEKEQSLVIKLSGLMFLAGFVTAGLNYRFDLYVLPLSVSVGAAVAFVVAYGFYAEVLRENTYLSRTIEVQQGQKVVDTGLYGIVRHPMYSVTLVLFLAIPLMLGSLISFVIFIVYPVLIAKRIRNEEELLERELEGYKEYKNKVKYRLIPFIW